MIGQMGEGRQATCFTPQNTLPLCPWQSMISLRILAKAE